MHPIFKGARVVNLQNLHPLQVIFVLILVSSDFIFNLDLFFLPLLI